MKSYPKLLLLATALLLIGVWASTLAALPWIVSKIYSDPANLPANGSPGLLSVYGTVGDMFGAVNALFSAFALGGVALTLWVDIRSRRESRKPLVVCTIAERDGVTVDRPRQEGDRTILPIKFEAELTNESPDAALNVLVELSMAGNELITTEGLDSPLVKGATQSMPIRTNIESTDWEQFLGPLTSGKKELVIRLRTKYSSLEGVEWRTEVSYLMTLRAEGRDADLLNSVRGGDWDDEGRWTSQTQVGLMVKVKRGSWAHSKV